MSTIGESKRENTPAENKQDWSAIIGRHSQMMALEPRFMFDAAVADAAALVDQNQNAQTDPLAEVATGSGAESDAGSANAPGQENSDPFEIDYGFASDNDPTDDPGYIRPHDYLGKFSDDNASTGFSTFGLEFGTFDIGDSMIGLGDVDDLTVLDTGTLNLGDKVQIVDDAASPGDIYTVKLTVEKGSIMFGKAPAEVGLDVDSVIAKIPGKDGYDGTCEITITGGMDQINAYLASMEYHGILNQYGDGIEFKVTVDDSFGNSSEAFFAIDVGHMNFKPVVEAKDPFVEIPEDEMEYIPGLSIKDTDISDSYKMRLYVAKGGMLSLGEYDPSTDVPLTEVTDNDGNILYWEVVASDKGQLNDLLAKLQYTGAKNWSGDETLTIQVWDNYMLEQGEDPNESTFAIKVTAVNDDPYLGDGAILGATVSEDGEIILDQDDYFTIRDVDTGNHNLYVTITEYAEHGKIMYKLGGDNWVELKVGSMFTYDDLLSGKVKYVHDNEDQVRTENDSRFHSTDGFKFTLNDGAGGNIWVEPDPENRVNGSDTDLSNPDTGRYYAKDSRDGKYYEIVVTEFVLSLTPVNQPPVITVPKGTGRPGIGEGANDSGDGNGIYTEETILPKEDPSDPLEEERIESVIVVYEGETQAQIKFGVVDPDQLDPNGYTIKITDLDNIENGTLKWYNGSTWEVVTKDTVLTMEGINAGHLIFVHDGNNVSNTITNSFKIEVTDDGGGAGADKKLSAEAEIKISIRPNNNQPEFNGNDIINIGTESEPIWVIGQDADNYEIINADRWENVLGSGSGNGGFSLIDGDFENMTDVEKRSLVYTITEVPDKGGYLAIKTGTNSYRVLTVGDSFSQYQLDQGTVVFIGASSMLTEGRSGETEFKFTVRDGALTAWGLDPDGVEHRNETSYEGSVGRWERNSSGDYEWVPYELTAKIVYDIPEGTGDTPPTDPGESIDITGDKTMEVYEGGNNILTVDDLKGYHYKYGDSTKTEVASDNVFTYRIAKSPSSGYLYLVDGEGNFLRQLDMSDSFTHEQLANGQVRYQHGGEETFADSFTLYITDGQYDYIDENNKKDVVVNINVSPVNDTPAIETGELKVGEGLEESQNEEGFDQWGGVLDGSIISISDVDGGKTDGGFGQKNSITLVFSDKPEHGDIYVYTGALGADGKPVDMVDYKDVYSSNWHKLTAAEYADSLTAGDLDTWTGYNTTGTPNSTDVFVFTANHVNSGLIRYVHDGRDINAHVTDPGSDPGAFSDTIKFIVNDNKEIGPDNTGIAGTDAHGKEITGTHGVSLKADEVAVIISMVNDKPIHKVTNPVVTPEGGIADPSYNGTRNPGDAGIGTLITKDSLLYVDVDSEDRQLQYLVTSTTKNGTLYLNVDGNWEAMKVGSVFTQDDINYNRVLYIHNGTETHSDGFTWRLSDGSESKATEGKVDIIVTPTNNAPVIELDQSKIANKNDHHNYLDPLDMETGDGKLGSGTSNIDDPGVSIDGEKNLSGVFHLTDRDYTDFVGYDSTTNPSSEDSQGLDSKEIKATISATIDKNVTEIRNGYFVIDGVEMKHDAADGTLTNGVEYIITFNDATGEMSVELTGSLTAINQLLETLQYYSAVDLNQAVKIALEVDDQANGDGSGDGYNLTARQEVTLYISTKNDKPEFKNPGKDIPDSPELLEDNTAFIKPSDNPTGYNQILGKDGNPIQYQDVDAFDRTINEVVYVFGEGKGTIKYDMGKTDVNGVSISQYVQKGQLQIGSDGSLKGTIEAINLAMQHAYFVPAADFNGDVEIAVYYTDGMKDNGTLDDPLVDIALRSDLNAAVKFTVLPVNDAPTVKTDKDRLVIEGNGEVVGDKINAVVDDAKDLPYLSDGNKNITVTIVVKNSSGAESGELTYTTPTPGSVQVVQDAGTKHTIELTGTREDINAFLDTIGYKAPTGGGEFTMTVTVNDNYNGGNNGTPETNTAETSVILVVNGENLTPEISIDDIVVDVNGKVVVNEDVKTTIDNISINSRYPTQETMTVELELVDNAYKGTLVLENTSVCSQNKVKMETDPVTGKITLTGSQAGINNVLKHLQYTGMQNYNTNGVDVPMPAIKVTVYDKVNYTNTTDHLKTEKTIYIQVDAVNDAPKVTGTGVESIGTISEDVDGTAKESDVYVNNGKTVSEIFSGRFTDPNDAYGVVSTDSLAGVVIVSNAATAAQGTWQYFDGTAWQSIATNPGSKIFLGADVPIRFQPAPDFHGTPGQLEVRLVDDSAFESNNGMHADYFGSLDVADPLSSKNNGFQTNVAEAIIVLTGTATFTPAGGISTGDNNTSRFSNGTVKVGVTVANVNDAPVIDTDSVDLKDDSGTKYVEGTAINEEQLVSSTNADKVSDLFGSVFSDKNDNKSGISGGLDSSNNFAGIVVIGCPDAAEKGVWQYYDPSSSSADTDGWVMISTGVSELNGLFLDKDTQVRFKPVEDYNGTPPGLEVVLADDHNAAGLPAKGATVDVSDANRGDTSRYSGDSLELRVNVLPRNDAPVIDVSDSSVKGSAGDGYYVEMPDVVEDIADDANAGKTVSQIFDDAYDDGKDNQSDKDGANHETGLAGVVIVGNTATEMGEWQYSTNGADWVTIPKGVTLSNGFFLTSATSIRFQPAANYNGEPPQLTVRLVDGSTATEATPLPSNGATVNLTNLGSGGEKRYGAEDLGLVVMVTPANDDVSLTLDKNKVTNGGVDVYDVAGEANPWAVAGEKNTETTVDDITKWNNVPNIGLADIDYSTAHNQYGTPGSENDLMQVTISTDRNGVSFGYIRIAGAAGQNVSYDGDPAGKTITFTGTKEQIEAALKNIQYATEDFDDADNDMANKKVTLTVEINDMANGAEKPTGEENTWYSADNPLAKKDDVSVVLVIGSNCPPDVTITPPADKTVIEAVEDADPARIFGNGAGDFKVNIADSDSNGKPIEVTLSVGNGKLGLDSAIGSEAFDSGTSWNVVNGVITITAKDQADINTIINNYVTYQANANYNGGDTLTISATDNGRPLYVADDAAFDSDPTEKTVGINVKAVNDAPKVDGAGDESLGSVAEDVDGNAKESGVYVNNGKSVSDIFGGRFDDPNDVVGVNSEDNFAGVVIVGNAATAEQGEWQYFDGTTWQSISTTPDNKLFLGANVQIRFQPAPDFHGTPGKLEVLLVDDSEFESHNGQHADYFSSIIDTNPLSSKHADFKTTVVTAIITDFALPAGMGAGDGNTSRFSNGTVKVGVTVANVNDAPIIDAGSADLKSDNGTKYVEGTAINEEQKLSPTDADTVSDLFGSVFSDENDDRRGNANGNGDNSSNNLGGIVVIGCPDAADKGVWQYYDPSSSSADTDGWVTISTGVSESNGLFLDKDTQVRFKPAEDYNGTPPGLEVVLADDHNAAGLPARGDTVDVSDANRGDTSRYSGDSLELRVNVLPRNDAPVIDTGDSSVKGSAGDGYYVEMPAIDEDIEDDVNGGRTVSQLFGDAYDDGKDNQVSKGGTNDETGLAGIVVIGSASTEMGTWEYSADNGDTWIPMPTNLSESNGLFLDKTTAIRFQPNANYNGEPPRLTVRLVDGSTEAATEATPLPDNLDPVDLTSIGSGGETRYGAEDLGLAVTVKPVNDDISLTLDEDSATNGGVDVHDIDGETLPWILADNKNTETNPGNITKWNDIPNIALDDLDYDADYNKHGVAGAENDLMQVTISTDRNGGSFGYIRIDGEAGENVDYVGDSIGKTLTFTGTKEQIEAALKNIQYATENFDDSDNNMDGRKVTLTVEINDMANGEIKPEGQPDSWYSAANPAAKTDDVSMILIIGSNSAPVVEVNKPGGSLAIGAVEDASPVHIFGTGNNDFSVNISDSDSAGKEIEVVLSVGNGKLGLDSSIDSGTFDADTKWEVDDGVVTITAKDQADINEIINKYVTYQAKADFNGADALTISATDKGRPLYFSDDVVIDHEPTVVTVDIAVEAVNDAPTVDAGSEIIVTIPEDAPGTGANAGLNIKDMFTSGHDGTDGDPIDNGGATMYGDVRDQQWDADDNAAGSKAQDIAGIIVVGDSTDAKHGVWQYEKTSGVWEAFPENLAEGNGLFLAADVNIRFVPNPDYNGDPGKLTVHVVDASGESDHLNNTANKPLTTGDMLNIGVADVGGTTAISKDTADIVIKVDRINDAPHVQIGTNSDGTPKYGNADDVSFNEKVQGGSDGNPLVINEDTPEANLPSASVEDVFGNFFADAKDGQKAADNVNGSESNAFVGVVIVDAGDGEAGTWQYQETLGNWVDITIPDGKDGLYLPKGTDIRFNPAVDFNGETPGLVGHLVEASDSYSGATGAGGVDLPDTLGGKTEYSSESVTVVADIKAVNDAPVVNTKPGTNNPLDVTLDIDEDADETVNTSGTVGELFEGFFNDGKDAVKNGTNANDMAGIVIVNDPSSSGGVWQYKDSDGDWHEIEAPTAGKGVFIDVDTEIRFQPNPDWNGEAPTLTVRLVETGGDVDEWVPGQKVTVSAAFDAAGKISEKSTTISMAVRPINDAPIIGDGVVDGSSTGGIIAGIEVCEPGEYVPLSPNGDLGVFDQELSRDLAGDNNWNGATITVSRQDGAHAEDLFGVKDGGSLAFTDGDIVWNGVAVGSVVNSNGQLTLTFNANATGAVVNGVLNSITYANDHTDGLCDAVITLKYTVYDKNPDSNDGTPANYQGWGGEESGFALQEVNLGYLLCSPDTDAVVLDGERQGGTGEGSCLLNNDRNLSQNRNAGELKIADSDCGQKTGQYGTITINKDGTYSYVVDPSIPQIQLINPTDVFTETFTFLVTDGARVIESEVVITITCPSPNMPPAEESKKPVDEGSGNNVVDLPPLADIDVEKPVVDMVSDAKSQSDQSHSDSLDKLKDSIADITTGERPPFMSDSLNRDWALEMLKEYTLIGNRDDKIAKLEVEQDFTLPADIFIHSNRNERLTYTATQADGSPLPDWVEFNSDELTFTMTPPEGSEGTLELVIRAEDTRGLTADAYVNFKIGDEAVDDDEEDEVDEMSAALLDLADETDEESQEDERESDSEDSLEDLEDVDEDLVFADEWLFAEAISQRQADDAAAAELELADAGYAGLQREFARTGSVGTRVMAREFLMQLHQE